MVNKSYQIGYRFERRCIKRLESRGFVVIRSGKSKFPDFVALRNFDGPVFPRTFFGECKVNKYISKKEKEQADTIKLKTNLSFLVFYKEDRKIRWWKYGEKENI